jgi:hypothetical protein
MSSTKSQRRARAYPAVTRVRTCVTRLWLRRTHDYVSVQKHENTIEINFGIHYCPGKTFGTVIRNPHQGCRLVIRPLNIRTIYFKTAEWLSLFQSSDPQSASQP